MPSITSDASNYVVIIDAGSSGSRSYVFEWTDPEYLLALKSSVSSTLPQIHHDTTWAKKISPGIASFVHDKDMIWTEHLQHLIEHAESIIPSEKWQSTPIFFMATAGMRLLNQSDQTDLLDQIYLILREKTQFNTVDRNTNVQIIDGEVEGLYGWIALNYLAGSLDSSSQIGSNVSYGFMDMGGASAQIAFAPNASEAIKHEDQLYHVNLRTLDGNSHSWSVFLATWLRFGANEAQTRFSQYLVNQGHTEDPCLPKGLESDIPNTNQTQMISLKGTSNFDQCLKSIQPLLNKHIPCKQDSCLFNGQRAPALDFKYNKFVGVSEYWYTSHDIFGMDGMYDYGIYQEKVKEFCDSSWDDIVENSNNKNYHGIAKDSLQKACFKSTWIINILHEGFGVPIEPISGSNSLENSQFTAPFQSVSHINGIEMSWPLGRAVLYASGQIPTRGSEDPVGYYTALTSSDGAKFVEGSIPRYLIGGIFSHTFGGIFNQFAFTWFHLALIIFILFCFAKSRRLINISAKRLSTVASAWFKRSRVDSTDRILEEGLAMKSPNLSKAYSMETMMEGNPNGSTNSSERRSLGTSTSMLDLKSGYMISRESSRMGLRQENRISKD